MNGPRDGDEGYRVHLSDSSKTRREVLVYIFKPLLGDVFAFSSVNQVFETLGIKDDFDYISKVSGLLPFHNLLQFSACWYKLSRFTISALLSGLWYCR